MMIHARKERSRRITEHACQVSTSRIPAMIVGAVFALSVLLTIPALAGPCSKTSQAAAQACRSAAQADSFIGQGICANESDADAAQECKTDVKQSLKESKQDCADQLDARNEVCDMLGEDEYDPLIDPANFRDVAGIIANPNLYFPLAPGTTFVYQNGDETVRVTVTDETKEILGVTTIVVRDVGSLGGEVVEDTKDWFGQDLQGNVWYFGEISQEIEDGELVGIEGSWTAGVDGAKPGILIPASPTVSQVYRQEWALGEAEDLAKVTRLDATEAVPAALCNGICLETSEFSPLEPGHTEAKFYAPGVGLILELSEGGERLELIQIIHPTQAR